MPYTGQLGEAGLAKESVLGTNVPPTAFMRFIPPFQFSDDVSPLQSKGVSGIPDMVTKVAKGAEQLKSGKIKFEVEPEGGTGETLMAAFGVDTMTEVASFTVQTGVNDTIDFNIGAGNLVATVAAGTYAAGQTQADAGTLCALIYNAIHGAEGAGTYTVSFSRTTGKFTIARTAGTFQMMFLTGTDNAKTMAPLIGFTKTDQTGSLTYTGSIAATPPFSHAFSRISSAALPSYSWWQKTGADYPIMSGCMLNKLEFDLKAKEFLVADADWAGILPALGITQSASYASQNPFTYDQAIITVAGSPVNDYEELKLTIENNVEVVHTCNNAHTATKIYSKGFKVSLSMTVVVENTTEWAKYVAGTASSVTIALTSGQFVQGTVPYSLTFVMTNVQYKQAPRPLSKDLLKITFAADAFSAVGSSTTLTATLVNSHSAPY